MVPPETCSWVIPALSAILQLLLPAPRRCEAPVSAAAAVELLMSTAELWRPLSAASDAIGGGCAAAGLAVSNLQDRMRQS